MNIKNIDHGNTFDFGKTAEMYAKYRDIYPTELYEKLYKIGVGHSGEKWLDIGTGTGVLPKNMIKYGSDITGVDISQEQIDFAIKDAQKNNLKINYLVSSAEDMGMPDNSFNCITAAQCFWYFDRERMINEIRRMLISGGIFVKIYMTYTLDDEIAKKSHLLLKSMNNNWTPGASGSRDMYNHPFENPEMDIFESEIPFTRESWHGRMCACRGTMASMDEETFQKWDKAHKEMLMDYPQSFYVKHKIYIASYRICK